MTKKPAAEDEGIRPVRDVRKSVSAEWENDARKLVEQYMAEQERYRERLIRPVVRRTPGTTVEESPES